MSIHVDYSSPGIAQDNCALGTSVARIICAHILLLFHCCVSKEARFAIGKPN